MKSIVREKKNDIERRREIGDGRWMVIGRERENERGK